MHESTYVQLLTRLETFAYYVHTGNILAMIRAGRNCFVRRKLSAENETRSTYADMGLR